MNRNAGRVSVIACLAVAVVALGAIARGAQGPGRAPFSFRATLQGAQEVPAISTEAGGEFRATLSQSGSILDYELSFSGLQGTTTLFAHIHIGQANVNGGVMVFLCGGGDKPACPNGGGTVTGSIDSSDVIGPSGQGVAAGEFDDVVRAMSSGIAYANVHTNSFPGGEIRGQIQLSLGGRPQ